MSLVALILIYFSVSLFFMALVFFLIVKRSKKHKNKYPLLFIQFESALKEEDNKLIIEIGDKLIWNDHFTIEHREFVFKELDQRVKENPELKEVWKAAYFKRYGLEINE